MSVSTVISLIVMGVFAIGGVAIRTVIVRLIASLSGHAGKALNSVMKTATEQLDYAIDRRYGDPESLRQLQQQDPRFSQADIEAKVKNWVMMFEQSWCNGDMLPCRPFLSDSLYHDYQRQLDAMKQRGELNRTEDLAVTACKVNTWRRDGDREYLDINLKVKKRSYTISRNDPSRVLRGNRDSVYQLNTIWQLMRSAGSQTQNAGIRVEECPNCGAQTSLNQSGQCSYCRSTISAESFDWVLNKTDKLSQTSYRGT